MTQKFRTAVADPPWLELGGGKIQRGANKHYDLLKTKDIPGVITGSGLWNFEENAHFYCWVTNNFLKDGLWLMEELGFRYVTNIIWMKEKIGIGQYFRGKHEILLFGVRGKGLDSSVCTDDKSIPSAYVAPHEKEDGKIVHSRKPEMFYEMIESRSKGPYLEMFARNTRKDWISWGNEI